ncbi:MAG: hypothetical protein V9H26_14775 [Verrucomicrobiota bacterium]
MIAIHHLPGSFSDRWETYCAKHQIPFIAVNLFDHAIVRDLQNQGIRGLLFNPKDHAAPRTRLAARAVCQALELGGITVFPNSAGYWHCDDKIAQHYLLESLRTPRCPTYIFYDLNEALHWGASTHYPKVFKLRCGAGSSNVQLVRNRQQGERLIRRMFGRGLRATLGIFNDLGTKVHKHRTHRDWHGAIRRLPQTLSALLSARRETPRERGYAYFQEFLPNNDHDTRVTIIGNRAFAFRRLVRPNDFRASGSGRIDFGPAKVDLRCVRIAFNTARQIGAQCLAFDFALDATRSPVVLEMCYAFVPDAVFKCPGYWDEALEFHERQQWPQDAIMEDFVAALGVKSRPGELKLSLV